MSPELALGLIIRPTLSMMGDRYQSREAEIILLAMALQESGLRARRQRPVAFARGFWQFEKNGGVRGVIEHPATRDEAERISQALIYDTRPKVIHRAMEHNDILACAWARLFLWPVPSALPRVGHEESAWTYYVDRWAPGKPRPRHWPDHYARAMEAV